MCLILTLTLTDCADQTASYRSVLTLASLVCEHLTLKQLLFQYGWTRNGFHLVAKCVFSDQWFYLLHHSLNENIISVMHNIVPVSIRLFVIFKSLWTSLSCNGAPAGHLTPVCPYYFTVVWSKMAPPMGFVTSECPPHLWVVVSCGEEAVEGLTAGGLSRQDSCGVWNRDACQLCKARLSPCIVHHLHISCFHCRFTCFKNVSKTKWRCLVFKADPSTCL